MPFRLTPARLAFQIFNFIALTSIMLCSLLPLLNVLAQSFSSAKAIDQGRVLFWPVEFTTVYYQYVFQQPTIWRAFGVSTFVTVLGTLINLSATASLAYPLSRKEFLGKKIVLVFILLTMIFSVPLIPEFIWIKKLHIMNTLLALMLPTAISAFNLFVMRSFFLEVPSELIDSCRIDGCGELRIIWNLILPLSKPVMATLGIFYAVMNWNTYKNALYFINSPQLYPLQVKLREMLVTDTAQDTGNQVFSNLATASPQGIQMTVVVVATLPIILIYPFLQRHFIKGLMIGSLKG